MIYFPFSTWALPVAVTILNTITIADVAFQLERPNEIMPTQKALTNCCP